MTKSYFAGAALALTLTAACGGEVTSKDAGTGATGAGGVGASGGSSGVTSSGSNGGASTGSSSSGGASSHGGSGGMSGGGNTGVASSSGGSKSALISFRRDLLAPAPPNVGFEFSCGLSSSCHHDPVRDSKNQRVFLGCNQMNASCIVMGDVAEQVYIGIVNKPSTELPSMNYVKPNDPDNSYLLHKIENNLNGLTCVPVNMNPIVANAPGLPGPPLPCGYSMPLMSDLVPDFASKVRTWITQGALDN